MMSKFVCRNCGCKMNKVTHTTEHTIKWKGGTKTVVRRRRICRHCNLPFTTVETHEHEDKIGIPDMVPEETIQASETPDITPTPPTMSDSESIDRINQETPQNPFV